MNLKKKLVEKNSYDSICINFKMYFYVFTLER